MLDAIIAAAEKTRRYAHAVLDDIPAADFALPAGPVRHHPAWVVGHIAITYDSALEAIGEAPRYQRQWFALCGFGTDPAAGGEWPSRDELMAALDDQHDRFAEAVGKMDPALLSAAVPDERLRAYFPSIAALLMGCCGSHEGIHLGQVSIWREARGMSLPF